MTTSALVNGK